MTLLSLETSNTFDSQVTQLKQHLKTLEHQQVLNSTQPHRKAELIQEQLMVQLQLQQLYQASPRS
jgi:hypothetical protein